MTANLFAVVKTAKAFIRLLSANPRDGGMRAIGTYNQPASAETVRRLKEC